MSEPSNAEIARREKWAAQENQRRQSEYQRADIAWTQDDQAFDWMLKTARSGTGIWAVALGFITRRDESVYGTFADCRLIEVKRGAGTYQGGYSGFSFRVARGISYRVGGSRGTYVPGPEQLRITDEGQVVVSDKRVVFQGGLNSREWAFGKLISIQHDPSRPITMIHVSNRQKVSGISYPAEQAPQVRFALELGASMESGRTHELIEGVQAERAAHARLRPAPPALVTAADAPSRGTGLATGLMAVLTGKPGQSPGRRILHTAVAAVTALLLFNGAAGALSGHPAESAAPQTFTSAPASTLAPAPEISPTPTTVPTAASPTATEPPAIEHDTPVHKVKTGPKPTAPKLLATSGTPVRVGATCRDGSHSDATGQGACSWHNGVRKWLYEQPAWVQRNKSRNAERLKDYRAALKKWTALTKRNLLLEKYPCAKGPYPEGRKGYASWRDSNDSGVACD